MKIFFFKLFVNVQCCLSIACVLEACSIAEERHRQTICSYNVSCLRNAPKVVFCQLNGVIVLDDKVLLGLPDK